MLRPIADLRPPEKEAPRAWLVPASAAFILLTLLALGLSPAIYRLVKHPTDVESEPLFTSPPAAKAVPLEPIVVTGDPSGRRDVVTIAHENGNYRAVLLDRKTLAVRWRSNAFARVDQVRLAGTHLVIADATGTVHVLAVATGREEHTLKLASHVAHACVMFDGQNTRVVVNTSHSDATARILDTDTGTLTDEGHGSCSLESDDARQCRSDEPTSCVLRPDRMHDPRPASIPDFWATEVLEHDRFYVVRGRSQGDPTRTYGVAWERTQSGPSPIYWEGPLADDGDRETSPGIGVLDRRSVFFLYPSATKKVWRLTTRSAMNGARPHTIDLPAKGLDKQGALSVDDDRAFAVIDDTLHVIDLTNSRVLASITSL